MNTRTLTTTAVDRYLKLLRRPADITVGLLPGRSTGPSAAARLAVDRADAAARSRLASVLGVDLTADARRRQAATDERARALDLRRQAKARQASAEGRVQTSHRQASQRRVRAESQAGSRRRAATQKEQTRSRQAAESERRRTQASREQEQQAEVRIAAETAEERLPAVEAQADALAEREQAVAHRGEAERLGDAAARVKEERKAQESGTG